MAEYFLYLKTLDRDKRLILVLGERELEDLLNQALQVRALGADSLPVNTPRGRFQILEESPAHPLDPEADQKPSHG